MNVLYVDNLVFWNTLETSFKYRSKSLVYSFLYNIVV